MATYTLSIPRSVCRNEINCWFQFQAPEDAFRVEINNNELISLYSNKDYHSNEFFLLPLSVKNLEEIIIQAKDSNQDLRFQKKMCLKFGNYNELSWVNGIHWFLRTGSNLFSAYFLLIISFYLGFSFWLRRSGLGLSLLVYSVVSIIYLVSFSEYPRSVFDPVIASGGIHFPLRLLQDLCLIFVFYNFHQQSDPKNIIKKISWVYAAVISVYVLMLVVGVKDYLFYSRIIIIMAPLVAAPMAIGTWFSLKLKDPIERKVLIPISILLFIFQLNDLFVFWKLSNSYFTVRLYIPFIVGMCLFLYFRRMHEESTKISIYSERQRILKEFLHDIKSPLAVLRIFFASKKESEEHNHIINSALDRVENMVRQIDRPNKNASQTKFRVLSSLHEVMNQKELEYSDIRFIYDFSSDAYIFADKGKIQRIFSNIINNAYEAYTHSSDKVIEVKIIFGHDDVRILFSDKGKGITKSILEKLFKEEITSKPGGQGIGLSSANRYITDLGGNLQVISREALGTTIEITLLSTTGDIAIDEIEKYSSNIFESPDLILIDDDRYIRLSWNLHAKNTGKRIKTYDSLDGFFADAYKINKNTPIYLDVNLNGERSLNHLIRFEKMGFNNLTLATGEDITPETLPPGVIGISGKLPPLQ